MAEESSLDGSEKEEIDSSGDGFGDLASMDSIESRWVIQDDDDSEIGVDDDNDEFDGTGLESEDEEIPEHRLIRTGPRVDSFDVEALEVPGAPRNDYEDLTVGRRVLLEEDQATNRSPGVKAAKGRAKRHSVEGKALSEFQSMWAIKEKDLAMKENLLKMSILNSLIAKKEPLSDYEEALKKKLITDMLAN